MRRKVVQDCFIQKKELAEKTKWHSFRCKQYLRKTNIKESQMQNNQNKHRHTLEIHIYIK